MKRIRVTIRASVIDSCCDWSWLIADWQYTAVIGTKYGLRSDYRLSSSTLTNSRVLERYPVMGWTTCNSGSFVCIVHPADIASNFLTFSLSFTLFLSSLVIRNKRVQILRIFIIFPYGKWLYIPATYFRAIVFSQSLKISEIWKKYKRILIDTRNFSFLNFTRNKFPWNKKKKKLFEMTARLGHRKFRDHSKITTSHDIYHQSWEVFLRRFNNIPDDLAETS